MQLIFVRHGETIWNRIGRFQGASDIELSDTGILQAEKVALRFKGEKIDHIYSSPYKRAYATAVAIKGDRNITIHKDIRLGEIDFGEWEGKTFQEVEQMDPENLKLYRTKSELAILPGEGSLENVRKRAAAAVDEIIARHRGTEDRILIAAHGGIIRLAIFHLLNIGKGHFQQFFLGNTAVSIVDVEPNINKLESFNDISHLI